MTPTATTMTDKTGLPSPAKTELVPIAEIQRDERVNTRPVDTAWVEGRVGKFRPDALGIPAVSLRGDGTYIVINGQNRIALAKACGYGPEITCEVYEGLDLAQEAGLFVLLNDGRAVRPGHRFRARVTQKEPVACAILTTAQRAGWEIDVTPGPGKITAVTTLERLWNDDRRHFPDDSPFVLANTLQSIIQAWQHTRGAQDAAIIMGIGLLYVKHGLAVDPDHMAARLAEYEGGPAELLAKARGLARYQGGSTAHSVAELVTTEYNKDRPRRRLPRYR